MRLFVRAPWQGEGSLVEVNGVRLSDSVGFVVGRAWELTDGDDSCCAATPPAREQRKMPWRTRSSSCVTICDAGGRVVHDEWTVGDAGLQKDSVLSIVGKLPGGMIAMQIAYRRSKESKKNSHEHSPFMKAISEVSETAPLRPFQHPLLCRKKTLTLNPFLTRGAFTTPTDCQGGKRQGPGVQDRRRS